MMISHDVKALIEEIKKIMNEDFVNKLVNERIIEFTMNGCGDEKVWLKELTYCILVANTSAKKSLECIEALTKNNALYESSKAEIERILRNIGYRYPKVRSEYIIKARENISNIRSIVKNTKDDFERRNWLMKNVIGLGMKESSHFLRNLGYFNYAIIDRHVINVFLRYNIINENYRKLSMGKYLKIEEVLKEISFKVGLKPGILDLFIWYMDTGNILK